MTSRDVDMKTIYIKYTPKVAYQPISDSSITIPDKIADTIFSTVYTRLEIGLSSQVTEYPPRGGIHAN